MWYVQIPLMALGSFVALYLLTKLMGEKQISQMSIFDYITGITIGSIAAEMATELETPQHALTAMVVYGLATYGLSIATKRCLGLRKLVSGRPILLFHNGVLYRQNFAKAHLDLSEFLSLCRLAGYYDLRQVYTAILEHNGNISFIPVSKNRPLTPEDMNLSPEQEQIVTTVIMDGKVIKENLRLTGHDEQWLMDKIKEHGFASPKDIFLGLCDSKGQFAAYRMENTKKEVDWFE